MNLAIVPDSAPAENSGQAVAPHTKPTNLQTQIEQTERLLTYLRQLQEWLEAWTVRWRAYAIESAEFEATYQSLKQVGLTTWADQLDIDDLRVALGQNPVLPGWLGVTRYTIIDLEAWLVCLKRWENGEHVPPDEAGRVCSRLRRMGAGNSLFP